MIDRAARETSPTVALLRGLRPDPQAMVSLQRVLRQRTALAEFSATALHNDDLGSVLDQACRHAAEGCETPYAKILELRAEEHAFVVRAGYGWDPGVIGRARASADADNPIGEALKTGQPVTVADVNLRDDYHLPPLYTDYKIVSSTNVPVVDAGGFYGVLEVDDPGKRVFDMLDTAFLVALAGIVAESVNRVRRETALRAAYNATALLLREHYHRVRNNFQTILALVQRHARDASSENSRARIEEIGRRIFGLSALYNHLLGADVDHQIALGPYIAELCVRLREFYRLDERPIDLVCDTSGVEAVLDVDCCSTVGVVVNELVANALEHAFGEAGGRIRVGLKPRDDGAVVIQVEDNGCGFSGAAPASIGLGVARRLMSWIGGSLALDSAPGRGATWTALVPRERLRRPALLPANSAAHSNP